MEFSFHLAVADSSSLGEARRHALYCAASMGLDETQAGKAAIIATEMATNFLKHATSGMLIFSPLRSLDAAQPRSGLEILALDKGSGITDIAQAMQDGYSTAGSPGTGLGAMARLADEFDLYSDPHLKDKPGQGTVIMARLWTKPAAQPLSLEMGAICLPYPGEKVSGDAWAARLSQNLEGEQLDILVADGIGHGLLAYEASSQAAALFATAHNDTPGQFLERAHQQLRATRGAAVAVARLHPEKQLALFSGLGNIAGSIITNEASRGLASHSGIIGHQMPRSQEFSLPFPQGAILILHSDGVATRWNLAHYPGLRQRHAGLIAGVLFRDFQRGRDDATLVVIRWREGARRSWA